MSVKYNNETIAGKYKTQIIDTSKFATKDEVNDLLEEKANTSDIPDVTNFITMANVEEKGYLTEVPSEYITQIELDDKGYARLVDIQGKADASTVNEQLELKADKSTTYTKSEVDDKIADAVTGGQIDLSGYAKDGEVVHLANSETITGTKTFTQPLKIQNGAGTGSLLIGGDVNAGTVTNGARKLARIAVPTQANKDLTSILLGFDSNGDDALNITNIGSDNVSFGGSKKITNATSPMSISFCVAKERNATDASKKTYALEMDANEARFNSRPNYNGVNLATTVDVTNALGSYAKLTDIPDVSNYITMNDVEEKGYLTEHQDISNLATKTELTEGLATKQPTGNYALKSDIPDVSNFATKSEIPTDYATKTELQAKQGILTAGENIAIENNVISATINTSNLATKTDVANKQDKFIASLPLTMGGLKTSTTNISYDNNGKAYLNDVAYYATISECLPTEPIANYEIRSSFYDDNYTNGNCEFRFYKLKGYTEKYPILNLDGYNAILHDFSVGDIVMADSIKPYSGDYNDVQMCFGQIENDGTFVPKLMCLAFGWSSSVRFAKITRLYEPDEAYKRSQEQRMSSSFYMKYYNDVTRMSLSYKNQSGISDIANIRGIKFVEKDGAVTVAWVRENGEIVELSDTLTFDKIDFNCVIFNGYVYDNSNITDTGIYGFDPTKYFVAKDTINNVVSKMIDGTGTDSLSIKYSDDFILNENNELKLKNAIPDINNLATKEDIKNKQSSLNDTSTIDVDDTNLTVIGVQSKSGTVLYDWIGTKEEYETGIANGSILEDWICWVTDDEGGDKYRSMPIGSVFSVNANSNYVPEGCLPCDGAEYSKVQFSDLWGNYLTGEEVTTSVQYYGFYGTGYGGSEYTLYATSTTPVIGQIYEQNINGEMVLTSLKISEVGTDYIYFNGGYNDIMVTANRDETLDVTKDSTTYATLLNTCDYSEYEADLVIYGQCGKFAVDTTNEKFRVPFLKDGAVIQQALSNNELGKSYNANISIPNTSWSGSGLTPSKSNAGEANSLIVASGVVEGTETLESLNYTNSQIANITDFTNNAISLRYFVVVANGTVNQSLMDWSQWSSNLSSKVDKNNLTDCAVVVRTSDKSILPSWYRVWSDGWVEQGGRLVSATSQTVELLVEMADTNYCLTFGAYAPISTDTEGWDMNVGSSDYTTTNFRVTSVASRNDNWKVEGYMR